MTNPKFYIYGVPDGFNMLSGTPDEILYYQLFYDTSKKGTELRINRKPNGETVYSYLKYNLVAYKGREGAFLGMSVAFSENEYCNNPVALKELFEGVYNEVILKADDKDRIIAAIDGGTAVGRFCIPKFAERQDMCEKLGRIIVNNIVGELSQNIVKIDCSFDNSKEGRILTLPFDTDNSSINQALRNYTWVSLSTEYKPVQVPTATNPTPRQPKSTTQTVTATQDLLSVHFIKELTKKVTTYKDFIIQGLKGMVSANEISAKREEINRHLDTLEEYVGKQPELSQLKEQYVSIYSDIVGLSPQRTIVTPPSDSKNSDKKNGQEDENNWMKVIQPYLSKIILGACAVAAIILVVAFWASGKEAPVTPPEEENEVVVDSGTDEVPKTFDDHAFNLLLGKADYKAAWDMLQQLENADKKSNLIRTLRNSYRDWLNKELKNNENNLNGLISLGEKIQEYKDFNDEYESDLQLLDAYIKPLQDKIAEEHERVRKAREIEIAKREAERRNLNSEESADETTNAKKKANDGVVHVYRSDHTYAIGKAISGSTIECKRNDHFVVSGATLTKADEGIEAFAKKNGIIQIRATNAGQYKVYLDKIILTFNVSR